MEEYEVEVYFNLFATSAPDGDGCLSSGSARFVPDKEVAGTQRKGGRFGHRAGLNTGNVEYFLVLQKIEP
jgi:hypothetical protein